jgi:phospholipid/cholesterol/gamma-HCH transport system permease protein
MMSANRHPTFVGINQKKDQTQFVLAGPWTIQNLSSIERDVRNAKQQIGSLPFDVSGKGIEKLDTSGALLLRELLRDDELPKDLSENQRALLQFLPAFSEYEPTKEPSLPRYRSFLSAIGRETISALRFLWQFFVFIGQVSVCFARVCIHPRRFRIPAIVRQTKETGVKAISIVGLLAVLISMVITYQGAVQLRKFGADIFTIDLTVISLLREMGVLVTAIMVAGRSGSAFAAEIGVMNLREEVNALRTMGVDPIEVLVLPRVLALLFVLPILTFIVDVVGLLAGSIMALSLIDVSIEQYFARVQDITDVTTFLVGMIKAPVFAFLIGVVGCYQGLNVSGSAESIGKRTTLAVVQSIFLVIMADALFSVAFSEAGI